MDPGCRTLALVCGLLAGRMAGRLFLAVVEQAAGVQIAGVLDGLCKQLHDLRGAAGGKGERIVTLKAAH